jgi:SAM-dependent methyltransferase
MNNKINYFNLKINFDNIFQIIKLIFKKKSPIRIFHNIFLKNIETNGITIDLGSGKHSSYLNYLNKKHNKIYFADKIYRNDNDLINVDLEKKLNITDEKFDTVLLFNVLEHINNYKNLIIEISRITKKNGNVEIFVPFMHRYHEDPEDIMRPTHKYLEKIILKSGLKIEKITVIGAGPLSVVSEIVLKYFKFSLLKIPIFFILIIIDKIIKYFSKDFNTYYLGVHCSCKK